MTLNRELLREVADVIEYADRFNLSGWAAIVEGDHYIPVTSVTLYENCDTAGCVAGWVCALVDKPSRPTQVKDIEDRARKLLGLSLSEAQQLFIPYSKSDIWPMRYPYGATAAQAAKVLRNLADGKTDFV